METGHVIRFTLSFSVKRHLSILKARHKAKGRRSTFLDMHRGVILHLMNIVAVVL